MGHLTLHFSQEFNINGLCTIDPLRAEGQGVDKLFFAPSLTLEEPDADDDKGIANLDRIAKNGS